MEKQFFILILTLALSLSCVPTSSSSSTRRFKFNLEWKNVTRLCSTRPILTINGEYPGPTIIVREGDNVEVKVTNSVLMNTTLHWHGIRQFRTGWADGPAYITQCPIGPGKSYTYKFTVVDQRGTLWWHAHLSWQRATVNGAFIIYPRMPYPFHPQVPVQDEVRIMFGEWWNSDVTAIENEMILTGDGPDSSNAYTINGLPGPLYSCSLKDTFIQTVEYGKTYLLRIINAALNDELFFAVADHTLTVVEIDAVYTKPFTTTAIMIAPGQTTNVLLTANYKGPKDTFVMAARPYVTSVFPFDNSTTIGFLRYRTPKKTEHRPPPPPYTLPSNLPAMEDTAFATIFADNQKSLGSSQYPCKVPKTIHKQVITTISLNLQDCPENEPCKGYHNKRFLASMNNQSFVRPQVSVLESHYKNLESSPLFSDFPEKPPFPFNYTGVDPVAENLNAEFGSKFIVVPYGTKLEIVLQDTNLMNPENHPIHVHGHNFFVVGRGFGNYDAGKDPAEYNLVDPPERNTVAVPVGGWAALRINADNPGVWFIHCHLEEHTTWGLAAGLIVQGGKLRSQRLLPPPLDFPTC